MGHPNKGHNMIYDNLQFGEDYKCLVRNKDTSAKLFITMTYVDTNCWRSRAGSKTDLGECYEVLSADLEEAVA